MDNKYLIMVLIAVVIMATMETYSGSIPWTDLYRFTTSVAIVTLLYHLMKGDSA